MIDVNDVKPEFSNETYMFRFDENRDLNTHVGVISATYSELGTGDMSTYSLADRAKVLSTPFNVSDDGIILVRSALDYEAKDVYEFEVLIKCNRIQSPNKTADVLIEVVEKNDNAPHVIFPSVHSSALNVTSCDQRHLWNVVSRENAFLY